MAEIINDLVFSDRLSIIIQSEITKNFLIPKYNAEGKIEYYDSNFRGDVVKIIAQATIANPKTKQIIRVRFESSILPFKEDLIKAAWIKFDNDLIDKYSKIAWKDFIKEVDSKKIFTLSPEQFAEELNNIKK